jgi:hypothetical protein
MHLPDFVFRKVDGDRELYSVSWNYIECCEGGCRVEHATSLREVSSRTSPEIAAMRQTSLIGDHGPTHLLPKPYTNTSMSGSSDAGVSMKRSGLKR